MPLDLSFIFYIAISWLKITISLNQDRTPNFMTLDSDVASQLIKIFAGACAQRSQSPAVLAKPLDPVKAVAILRQEFAVLTEGVASLHGDDYDTVIDQIRAYNGRNPADVYEHLLTLVNTLGVATIERDPPPTNEEYIRDYLRVTRSPD
jgi:hypothetical protein